MNNKRLICLNAKVVINLLTFDRTLSYLGLMKELTDEKASRNVKRVRKDNS